MKVKGKKWSKKKRKWEPVIPKPIEHRMGSNFIALEAFIKNKKKD